MHILSRIWYWVIGCAIVFGILGLFILGLVESVDKHDRSMPYIKSFNITTVVNVEAFCDHDLIELCGPAVVLTDCKKDKQLLQFPLTAQNCIEERAVRDERIKKRNDLRDERYKITFWVFVGILFFGLFALAFHIIIALCISLIPHRSNDSYEQQVDDL